MTENIETINPKIRGTIYLVENAGLHDFQDAAYPYESFEWKEIETPFYSCLCDGVSGGYHSGSFARLVAKACGTGGVEAICSEHAILSLGDAWIQHESKEIDEAYPHALIQNRKEKKLLERSNPYHRLAATTVNIVEISPGCQVVSYNYGDTVFFHFNSKKELTGQNPRIGPNGFTNLPKQINTDKEYFSKNWMDNYSAPLAHGDILVQATDALALWMLSDSPEYPQKKRVEDLLSLSAESSFEELVLRERKEGRLHNDDTSFVKYEVLF